MCGIIGIIRRGNGDLVPELRGALGRLAHRGPDDNGVWRSTTIHNGSAFNVGLGHVRLSIIDLSSKGRQPMVDSNGAVITYNGEIYNYLELRQELKSLAHEFKTDTDTEVILAAYRQWGESCVKRFVGMWALAIWDGRQLFLSRDRLGKKPLYLYQDATAGLLAFASEIKGLRGVSGVPWQPHERTVFRFLAYAEMEREGRTFYEGIRELPPGTCLRYVPGAEELKPIRYWTLSDKQYDVDDREAVAKTSELLHESIRLRLRSDAPLGLSLSGGLDSTLLLSLLNESGIDKPPVFSAGYEEPGYSETRYIDIATGQLSCEPSAAVSDASPFKKDFEPLIYHLDQPSKLPGPYSLWRVAEIAGNRVKVLIDGQGADELAGGYMYYLPVSWSDATLWQKIYQCPDLFLTILGNRHVLSQYSLSLIWERVTGKVNRKRQLPLKPKWASEFSDVRPTWEESGDLNSTLRRSVTHNSLPALLRYGDRVNMAFGVENRCPFLDHRLIEYVSALPSHMKIRGGTTKWIFREVADGRIPKAILKRRLKMGFPTPLGVWLRKELPEVARQWLDNYRVLPFFDRWIDVDEVYNLLDEHISGKADHQALLWRLLSVGAWLKTSGIE
ncbi:MAG: asparagine synthase (glutamine-hydrolysing) [Desulfobacteraceae bacterium Eth-SRB2]|nr:MAG: asparagine synthase (glutamine-hydrolysing) [Desulfobacteraceae bacterium Eth-SRB2]